MKAAKVICWATRYILTLWQKYQSSALDCSSQKIFLLLQTGFTKDTDLLEATEIPAEYVKQLHMIDQGIGDRG